VDAIEPLALELRDFCESVRTGRTPRSSAKIGLDVVRMVEAVEESLDLLGAPVAPAESRTA